MLARSLILLSVLGAALASLHGSNHPAHLAARDAVLQGNVPSDSSLFERALGLDESHNESGLIRLAKRSSCSKASQCKSKLKANAVHQCMRGHCAQVCKSGYKSSYGKCVKKAASKKKSTKKSTKKTTKKATTTKGRKAASSTNKIIAAAVQTGGSVSTFTYSGQATFFYQGGNAGHCGRVNSDSTPLVALTTELYGNGGYCGKYLNIKNTANGKTVKAVVADSCPGCATKYSLDLSVGAFDAIGEQSTGVLPIVWSWA